MLSQGNVLWLEDIYTFYRATLVPYQFEPQYTLGEMVHTWAEWDRESERRGDTRWQHHGINQNTPTMQVFLLPWLGHFEFSSKPPFWFTKHLLVRLYSTSLTCCQFITLADFSGRKVEISSMCLEHFQSLVRWHTVFMHLKNARMCLLILRLVPSLCCGMYIEQLFIPSSYNVNFCEKRGELHGSHYVQSEWLVSWTSVLLTYISTTLVWG